MEALIVVDVQNDFCPGGALPVPDGDAVVEPVNRLASAAPFVVATRDWHPADHDSFATQGGPWPVHCVAGTAGAELHPGIERITAAVTELPFDRLYDNFGRTIEAGAAAAVRRSAAPPSGWARGEFDQLT